jgi:glycosyltransferase involved in cell wall biosynthesis
MLEQLRTTSVGTSPRGFEEGFVEGRISIIMPAYNEADNIGKSVVVAERELGSVTKDFEIIVVDDGSEDGTRAAVESLANRRVRLVSYAHNKGKGFALKEGFNLVTGGLSLFVDSDLEIQARDMSAYVKALATADVAIGSKRHPLSIVKTPFLRRFLSLGFNVLERLLTGVQASDTQAGLKAIRSSALYRILPLMSVKRYAFDAELLTVATLLDYRIVELPVRVNLRASFSFRQVVRITYRLRIRRWYQKNSLNMSKTYEPIIPW